MIYLDANATTPLRPEALAAIEEVLAQGPLNASSVHSAGQRARALLDLAREECAAALHCDPRELIFTSGGTESDHLAIRGGASIPGEPNQYASGCCLAQSGAKSMAMRRHRAQP